jgi:hypothetical protein
VLILCFSFLLNLHITTTMSETCYVTEVRLLTALEPLSPRAMAAKAAETVSKARFSFASIPWPFLPQGKLFQLTP